MYFSLYNQTSKLANLGTTHFFFFFFFFLRFNTQTHYSDYGTRELLFWGGGLGGGLVGVGGLRGWGVGSSYPSNNHEHYAESVSGCLRRD